MRKKLQSIKPSKLQESILVGTLLGDTCLRIQYNFPYGLIEHSRKQEEYLLYKLELLKHLCSDKIIRRTRSPHPSSVVKTTCSSSSVRIKTNPELVNIYNLFYKNGKKVITDNLLPSIDEIALAFWFMDDGNLSRQTRKTYVCTIATLGFTKNEVYCLAKYLTSRFGLNFAVSIRTVRGKETYILCLYRQSDVEKFVELIKEWVPKCMNYKIDISGRALKSNSETEVKCLETGEIFSSCKKAYTKYNIPHRVFSLYLTKGKSFKQRGLTFQYTK